MAERGALKILQITDLHLPENPGELRRDADAEARFLHTLNAVTNLPADLLLLTGDLSHHAPAAYDRLAGYVAGLPYPSRWIPGNHDLPESMQHYAGLSEKVVDLSHWRIIMLDSTSAPNGIGGGSLSESELAFLRHQLETADGKHCLLVLHHNPLPVASAWQDRISLGNPDALWQVVNGYPWVKGIIFGHLHHQRQQHYGDIPLFCSPATAPQYRAGTVTPEVEPDPYKAAPAYSEYHLGEDGTIAAKVVHLPDDSAGTL